MQQSTTIYWRRRWHGDGGSTAAEAARGRRLWRWWRRGHGDGGGTAGEAATGGGVLEVLFVFIARALAVLFFFVLAVCRIRTFNVGIRSTYLRISSVRGPSMSENPDKKVCRHTQNHVANIGMSGQNLATFRHVADMSPTCRRHYQPRQPPLSTRQMAECSRECQVSDWGTRHK